MTSHDNNTPQIASPQMKDTSIVVGRCHQPIRRRVVACFVTLLIASWFGPNWFAAVAQWRAWGQLTARDPEKALWWLDLAAFVAGANGEERFLRARVERKMGNVEILRSLLVQAFELGYPRDRLEREYWLSLAQTGKLRQAEPHLEKLLMDPQGDAAEICEAYVNGFGINFRFDDSVKVLNAWIADFRDDPYPYYLRARTFRMQKKNDESVNDFRRALQLKPDYHAVALELGEIHAERQDLEEAMRYFQIAQNANSEIGRTAQVGQARCYRKQGQSEKARKLLHVVLSAEPGNAKAVLELSHIDLEEQQPEKALKNLQDFYIQQPRNIEVRNTLAQALQATGNQEEAREHFKYVSDANAAIFDRKPNLIKILGRRFDDLEARYELGVICLQYESEDKGLQWLMSILDVDAAHRPTLEFLLRYHEEKAVENPSHRILADRFRKKLIPLSDSPINAGGGTAESVAK